MYTLFYRKPSYNPHRSYFQNQNRYAGCRRCNKEEVPALIEELSAKGCTNFELRDAGGRAVKI